MRLWRSGIGLSLLAHALAVCGLMRVVWHTPQRPVAPVLQGEIVRLGAEPEPAAPEERPAPSEPTARSADDSRSGGAPGRRARSQPANRTPPEAVVAPSAPSPAVSPDTTPSGLSVPDLVEARRRAATDVLEDGARADARRSFTFPGTIAQQREFDESERFRRREHGLGPPLTVFDSPAKGRAALPEERTVVYGVHWVSDDCYVFREPTERFAVMGMLIPPVQPITCTRPLARTDLFVTAKPSYLMHDEERAEVDAETQRRERLRRPTTGAVMPLTKD
jgi:hypothetical protein